MVVVSKADRSIKVYNLPENVSNDVLGFIFSESINVERKPYSTTATVEFGSVRDVENYIRKDKTLMIENRVLGIEGCSTKNEEPCNEDPLECRQLYIENLPRSTTTEYLDVLFPFAKSIKRLNSYSALAEYRTTKDAELELIKSKSLRIDRHQLNVRLAKECHRFGGGGHNSHDRHERGHSSSDCTSISNADNSEKKKTSADNFLFSGKEILSDLYGLPVEFGRSSYSRQRKGNCQDVWFKKQSEQTSKKESPINSATASCTESASCSRVSRNDTGQTKPEGSESKKENSGYSSNETDAKSNRPSSHPLVPERCVKISGNFSKQDKHSAATSGSTNAPFVWNGKLTMAPQVSMPGTSRKSADNPDKKHSNQEKYNTEKTKQPHGNYSSDNRRRESHIRISEERYKRDHFDGRAGERRVRNNKDKKNFERNRGSFDRERLNERDSQNERRKTPKEDIWREDNKVSDKVGCSRKVSCERFGTKVDDRENQRFESACPVPNKQFSGHRSEACSSERSTYRDDSVFNSRFVTDKMKCNYQDPDFSNDCGSSNYNKFPSSDNMNERMFNRGSARDSGRTSWGENEDKGMFSSSVLQNTRWKKDNRRLHQGGQNRNSNAEFESQSKVPLMDEGRFNERPNTNPGSLDRYENRGHNVQDRFSNDQDRDLERFNQGLSVSDDRFIMNSIKASNRFDKDLYIDPDRFNQCSVINERKFDRSPNMDYRKFDHGPNIDNTVMDQERFFPVSSNMDQGRFDKSSNISRERFDDHSHMDQERFDRGSNIDQGILDRGRNMDQGRFDKGSNFDRERFGWYSSMNQGRLERDVNMNDGKFDRVSNMDQGRFDRGSNGDCRKFMSARDQRMSDSSLRIEREAYMENKIFSRDPNIEQEKRDEGSKGNQNRSSKELRREQNRFGKDSSGDQNLFESGSNQSQNKFYRVSNQEQNRFGRGPNMDQSRCNVGPNIDQDRFDKGVYMDQNRFDRFPKQDQNRFGRSANMDQSRFNKDLNIEGDRRGRDPNVDHNRFDRGQNMNENRFDGGPNIDYDNLGNCFSINPDRLSTGPNMDQYGFIKDPSRNQNRYNHGADADQSRFGNNASSSQLSKSWKSNDQRFVKINSDRQGSFKDNLNIDSLQCWDKMQSRREIQPHGGPEKRTFNDMETGTQWRNNIALRNFRQEIQEFPNKKPRKDGSCNNGGGGYFNNSTNSSYGQNKQLMDSYAPSFHLPPPPLSSSRPQMMQSSLMSVTPLNHLVTSHRL